MQPPQFTRRVGVLVALGLSIALGLTLSEGFHPSVSRRSVLSLRGHRGIPDCAAGADRRLLEPQALECWFYDRAGAWRIVSVLSAHHALVVHVEVTDASTLGAAARLVVERLGREFGEVLVYGALVADDPPGQRRPHAAGVVTRIRWTPRDGFARLDFARPAAANP